MSKENPVDDIREIVRMEIREYYDIDGVLSRLAGENLNNLMTAQGSQCAIARIAGTDMPEDVVEMEFAALEHAGKHNWDWIYRK